MTGRGDKAVVSDARAQLCASLRQRRGAAGLSLDDISQVTRIPRPSLERLEAGRFEELPGDVFVRGFLRSYARCVGVDGEAMVQAYSRCGLEPAPVSSELADEILRQLAASDRDATVTVLDRAAARARAEQAASEAAEVEEAADDAGEPAEAEVAPDGERAEAGASNGVDAGADESAADAVAAKDDGAAESPAEADRPADDEAAASSAAATDSPSAAQPATRTTRRRRGRGRNRRGRRKGQRSTAPRANQSHAAQARAQKPGAAAAKRAANHERDARPRRPQTSADAHTPAATAERAATSADAERRPSRQRTFLPALSEDESKGRGALTFMVIVLVIVATLTMSYLLRRPSSPAEGFTTLPPTASERARA